MIFQRPMLYRVNDVELDLRQWEVRRLGVTRPAEPQVLALLFHLVRNRDRLVTKDELNLAVWNGRAVSDAAVSSRIKSARQLIGDDGDAQRLIRTIHGKGFRFVGPVDAVGDTSPTAGDDGKPSIAVLPFASSQPDLAILADGLPHELIAGLSRLKSLVVISRGSSFRFRRSSLDPAAVGEALGIDFVLGGSVHGSGNRLLVSVELTETAGGAVIWGEAFEGSADDPHALRQAVMARLLATLDLRIAHYEAERSRRLRPEQLDAWSHYHIGLEHAFRFNQADNAIALHNFEQAVAKQPKFARAHAAVSFARFQNSFMHYGADARGEIALARSAAEEAVRLDDSDPSANLMLGRSLWLEGKVEDGLPWIDRAIEISPNYAQAIYSRAWSAMVLGEPSAGQRGARNAIRLSPLDPLSYAMLAIDGFTEAQIGDAAAGAILVDRAAREPRAHVMIAVMAAICNYWAERRDSADRWVTEIRTRDPSLRRDEFIASFPFADGPLRDRVEAALSALGL